LTFNQPFKLKSKFQPAGDQPQAINKLIAGLEAKKKDQILLGITGSGKTFTMANIIAKTQRPTLIMAHNKTLAAQIYGEMKEFFPENEIGYFVPFMITISPKPMLSRPILLSKKIAQLTSKLIAYVTMQLEPYLNAETL